MAALPNIGGALCSTTQSLAMKKRKIERKTEKTTSQKYVFVFML